MKYELDNIYNEDSYKAIKDIPDNSIDLIIIDPPYVYDGNMDKKTGYGVFKDREKTIYDEIFEKNLDNKDYIEILNDLVRVNKNINIYIWCSKNQIKTILDFYVTKHGCHYDILLWQKTNAPPFYNNSYLTDKEYCLYFRNKGYCNPSSYENAKTIFTTSLNANDKKLYKHPTIKPLQIIKTLIKNSSKEDDIVADFFLGSGTTCVAAKELGRRYIGFEIDEEYYKIAKDRLNGVTANGQTSMFTDFSKLDI